MRGAQNPGSTSSFILSPAGETNELLEQNKLRRNSSDVSVLDEPSPMNMFRRSGSRRKQPDEQVRWSSSRRTKPDEPSPMNQYSDEPVFAHSNIILLSIFPWTAYQLGQRKRCVSIQPKQVLSRPHRQRAATPSCLNLNITEVNILHVKLVMADEVFPLLCFWTFSSCYYMLNWSTYIALVIIH